jgi:small subunit ribosomal protein S6
MPKATKGPKGSTKHHVGHYYVMRFDASPKTQHMVRKRLGLEPRLLRFSCVRLGRTLRIISKMGSEVEEWSENAEAKGVNIKDDDLLESYR